ncbi:MULTISPECIES: TonB-dependent receptor plug domain-containing protein [unclassified Caulobacter]|uniref:TonB-dependent receptor plug domain-containing protein n=1 Tax=unclassified Caulobacter TaxID=2648921 RepID=UPI0007815629|nr:MULTISPECIES: TonB-dependent receptor plug domain-containing protein [unclassified Caulobacter]AZS20999.1 TonB-dependent receptor [Caulobacter sp. FWC26]
MTLSTVLLYGLAAASLNPAADGSAPSPSVAVAAAGVGQTKAQQKDDGPNEVEGLVIQADPRGKVEGNIQPELELNEEEIKSFGANSIGELLSLLTPQTTSTRGRDGGGGPVMLINGRRISGFQEIQGVPPEAIERFQVLPEEVALSYGYKADQRVVNIILKKNYNATMTQASATVATDGGRTSLSGGGNRVRIDGDKRWNLDLQLQREPYLLETDRDIVRAPNGQPFDLVGNIGGLNGGEIDPALSAAAGGLVTIAGVPDAAQTGRVSLSAFSPLAGRYNTDDLTASRSLISKSDRATLRGSMSRDLNKTTQLTVTGNLEDTSSHALLGLPGVTFTLPAGSPFSSFSKPVTGYRYIDGPGALARETDVLRTQLSMAANGRVNDWRWNLTGDFDRVATDTTTGRGLDASAFQAAVAAGDPGLNPFGPIPTNLYKSVAADTAHSVSTSASAEFVLNGNLFQLPAGGLQTTFKLGADTRTLDSKTVRSGVTAQRNVKRSRENFQSSFTLPLTSTRNDVLAKVGDLSANFNAGYENLSDLGGLTTLGAGVNWTPIKPLSFIASVTDEEGAPSTNQINDPLIVTPNVSVFDFTTGQTVLVTRTDGGNPTLRNDNRRVSKFQVNYKPLEKVELTFNATYTRAETTNVISSFPAITPDLERAFPDRFTRDATGRLLAIDARPVNFASAEREDIRWGFNLFKPVGKPTPGAASAAGGGRFGGGPGGGGMGPMMRFGGPGGGPGGGGGMMGGGGPGGMMRPGQGMLQLSVYHTWRLTDELTTRKGLPVLDQLDGAAISSRNGQARHEVQVQGGYFKDGLGMRFNGVWKASTWVNGGATGGQTLYFSDLATLGMSFFASFNAPARKPLVDKYPILKGAQVSLNFENLFDAKQTVRDQNGVTPQAYQRDYLDPLGRTVRLGFRKLL